ncbi:MAG: glycoside hydrolase family 3 N-terminal domain-containing protein [Patescibacteria group bacterium]|nr:glycoside hydrolase family 3 N-terminal domain-containing protein [Patescibacteria group bacterium]
MKNKISNMESKPTLVFILVLTIIAVLLGFNYFKTPFVRQEQETEFKDLVMEATPAPTLSPDREIFEKLSDMERVAQLIAYPLVINETLIDELQSETACVSCGDVSKVDRVNQIKPGIIILFGSQISTESAQLVTSTISNNFASDLLKPLLAVDHEGGLVQRLAGEDFTKLPSMMSACQLDSIEQKELYEKSANELARLNIQIVFAPVVDVARSNSSLETRACLDEEEIKRTAQNYIESFGKYRIMSVIKHFPGIGQVEKNLHHFSETIALEPKDTQAFQSLLQQYPNIGVMSSHVRLEEALGGKPCSLSSVCLDRFSQVFPDATVFTDALNMESALEDGGERLSLSQAAEQALEAGNYVLVFDEEANSAQLGQVLKHLTDRYQTDESFKKLLDKKIMRILSLKLKTS